MRNHLLKLKKYEDIFDYLFLFIIFFDRSLIPSLENKIIEYVVLLFSFSFFALKMVIRKEKIKKSKFINLWIIYSLTIILSNIINRSDYYQGIGNLVVIGLFIYNIAYVSKDLTLKVSISYILCILINLIYSFINYGFQIPYSGVFGNPNYFGLNCLIMLIASMYLFINDIYKKSSLFLILISIILCLLSESTSIFIQTIIIVLVFIFIYKDSLKYKLSKIKNGFVIPLSIIGLLIGAIFAYFPLKKIYIKFFIYGGGITSFRSEIWTNIITNISFFGHANNRYEITNGFSEHNIFFAKLNSVGILPFIFLIIFVFVIIYFTYKYYRLNKEKFFIYFILTIILFLEGMNEEFFGLSLTSPALYIMLILGDFFRLEGKENAKD